MALTTLSTVFAAYSAYQFQNGIWCSVAELRNLRHAKSLKDYALSAITIAAKLPLNHLMKNKSAANQIQGLAQMTCLSQRILERRRFHAPISHDLIRLVLTGTHTTANHIALNPHLYPNTSVNYSHVAFGATCADIANTCVETAKKYISFEEIKYRVEDFKVRADETLLSAQSKIINTASWALSWLCSKCVVLDSIPP